MKLFEQYSIIVLLVILSLVLTVKSCNKSDKINEITNVYNSLQDTIQIYKNQDNLNVSKIAVLETSNRKLFTDIENLQGINKELQDLVKKTKAKTAIVTKTEIVYDTIEKTTEVVTIDTVNYIKLPYNKRIINKWIGLSCNINKDSTQFRLGIKDDFNISIHNEKTKWYKKPTLVAEVTNLNPYSTTKDLKVYNLNNNLKKHTFAISPGITYGYDIKGNTYLIGGITITPERLKIRF